MFLNNHRIGNGKLALALMMIGLQLFPQLSLGAGGRRKSPESGGGSSLSTPTPVRKVELRGVGTKPFQLPNGARVDLAADLEVLLNTAVTSTTAFAPTDAGAGSPCDTHLEIRAAVSTLQLQVAELGITFGYTPSGETDGLTGVTGSATVKIGTIAMDFSVWECVGGKCSSVAATTASHLTAGVNLSATLNFSEITTGPSLIFNTPLGDALRSIMVDGMKRLGTSSRLNELTWTARVREFVPETGSLIFDAGAKSRLTPHQTFVVYAVTPSVGICDVFKAVAYIHTVRVDTVSSVAVVDQILDSRGIEPGDLVMVRAAGALP